MKTKCGSYDVISNGGGATGAGTPRDAVRALKRVRLIGRRYADLISASEFTNRANRLDTRPHSAVMAISSNQTLLKRRIHTRQHQIVGPYHSMELADLSDGAGGVERPDSQSGDVSETVRICLNEWFRQYSFETIEEALEQAADWLWTYNNERSNINIGSRIPAQKQKISA